MNKLSRPDFWTHKGLLGLYLYTISLWLKYDVFISYSLTVIWMRIGSMVL